MKQCPNCGADAQDGWILCPSCRVNLQKAADVLGRDYYISPGSEPLLTNQTPPHLQETVMQPQSVEGSPPPVITGNDPPTWVLFLLILFGIPLAVLWWSLIIGGLILYFIIAIIISVVIFIDATVLKAGRGQKETRDSLTWSPTSWAGLAAAVFFIGIPLYLYRRPQIAVLQLELSNVQNPTDALKQTYKDLRWEGPLLSGICLLAIIEWPGHSTIFGLAAGAGLGMMITGLWKSR